MALRGTLKFADAHSDFAESHFVVLGAPFDRTTTFRAGTRFAPTAIREASANFEPYMFEHGISFSDIPVHDSGDLYEEGAVDEMVASVEEGVRRIVEAGKFPVVIGGEHSVTPPVVKAFGGDIAVVIIDAHLDYQNEYQGLRNSHACAHRRVVDIVGEGNVFAFGVRSYPDEEDFEEAVFVDALRIHEHGCEEEFEKALSCLKERPIYLSLDIDGIDPAFAPGTGTPEPFGLTPFDVKYIINRLGDRLVGFDVVEVSPPYDNGNTSLLAARFIKEVIAVKWKAMNPK